MAQLDPRLSQLFGLLNLSAPGLNRPLGAGDVIPYWGATPGAPGMTSDTQVAQPGPSFSPLNAAPFVPGSMLASLSSLLPAIAAAQQNIGNTNVPSGQANALPSTYAATPGIGSVDVNNALAAVNAPSAGGALPTNVQPIGGTGPAAAPAPVAPTSTVGGGGAAPGGTPGTPSEGSPGTPGTPSEAGVGAAPGGGGGEGGGPSGTVLCGWTVRHAHLTKAERRIALPFWGRTRRRLRSLPGGAEDFRNYQAIAHQITARLDTLPADRRDEIARAFKIVLLNPVLADRTWTPARADEALVAMSTIVVRFAQVFGIEVPPHSRSLALELVPLPEVTG